MIISILGIAGKDKDGNKKSVYYDCSKLGKKSGNYYNSTHFLIENYKDDFYFLGTKEAIEFQKELLDFQSNSIKIVFKEIEHNSLDDIFEKVYSLISKTKEGETTLLDITHGFRHQPISAIFSATLHKFLNNSKLNIIFAKQDAESEKYEYIYLNDYIEMTQLSLLLTGFINTLNFASHIEVKNLNTSAFERFSRALLSNDFNALTSSYKDLLTTLKQAKKDKRFNHLKNLFEEIESILSVFNNFEKKEYHQKYLILSKLMYDKNYYLLSLTYLFEAIRLYCSYSFYKKRLINNYAWRKFDKYKLNSDVMSFITQKEFKEYKPTYYDNRYPKLYENNQHLFEKIALQYKKLRNLRNTLTHINYEESQPNIKSDLNNLLSNIENLINTDILKEIKK